ncbi:MAG: chromosomal replication initiator protein DnaA [Betaproteobacteria bacterium]|nr:chromosomal replication initiator protein DnaA [Betaproteobacteria bacterium]
MQITQFWDACLKQFKDELSPQQFNTWIRLLQVRADASSLTLLAPNRFVQNWIRERFLSRIEAEASEFFGQNVAVALNVGEPPAALPAPGAAAEAVAVAAQAARPATVKPAESANASSLNPDFTFQNFVTGKANQLARAAGMQVSGNPGAAYNPLLVYGGVGLGKTHLIQAIGNEIRQINPGAKVRYIHAENYVSDVVRAYQHKSFDEFKRYYRSLDLLLVDDIQFFNGKSRTQEEFFYLFNTLVEAKKQVIITCDTYPKELTGIDERLISRLGWGLTVALEPPELEMRVAILLNKARAVGQVLDENVAFFVAKHIRSNVRELEGALKRILAYASFHNQEITLPVAKDALKDLIAVQNRQISIENIQKTVADYYKIKTSDMHSKKRSRIVARPRQVAMYLAKELTQLSLPEIGANFGGRDHTTILHGCRQIAKLKDTLPELNHDVNVLLQVLRG